MPRRLAGRSRLFLGLVSVSALAVACGVAGGDDTNLDKDGDKVLDSLGRALDLDKDGVADMFDADGDGTPDGIGIDTNGDGKFDGVGIDTDGDGIIDAVDTDGDGKPDIFGKKNGGDGDGTGTIDLGGTGGSSGPVDKPAGSFCDEFEVVFEPKTPTVYIVVDRSTSMFESGQWAKLRDSLLPVVESLQTDVRFGFASYTGEKGDDTTCGLDPGVTITENNYGSIETAWNALAQPVVKGETPTSFAIQQAQDRLLADASPGGRFILLVSDGSPDMCGDDYNDCGIDGTIAALQIAAKKGIKTLVFGIESSTVTQSEFDKFAQAGNGEAPVAPLKNGTEDMGKYDEYSGYFANICTNKGIWASLRTANQGFRDEVGMPASNFQPAAAYSSTPGTATAFLSSDTAALASQISSSLDGLKSCQIALNFQVKDASAGQIYVDDKVTPIPADQWSMAEGTTDVIEIKGDACAKWQSPNVDYFFAGFPCTAIVR